MNKQMMILVCRKYCGESLVQKNDGILGSGKEGTEVMFDTDDDNEPYEFLVRYSSCSIWKWICLHLDNQPRGFINPYSLYTTKKTEYGRGLPLEKIRCKVTYQISQKIQLWDWEKFQEVGIVDLVDGDPDVDAIHRLIYGVEIDFLKKKPLVYLHVILHHLILKIQRGWRAGYFHYCIFQLQSVSIYWYSWVMCYNGKIQSKTWFHTFYREAN